MCQLGREDIDQEAEEDYDTAVRTRSKSEAGYQEIVNHFRKCFESHKMDAAKASVRRRNDIEALLKKWDDDDEERLKDILRFARIWGPEKGDDQLKAVECNTHVKNVQENDASEEESVESARGSNRRRRKTKDGKTKDQHVDNKDENGDMESEPLEGRVSDSRGTTSNKKAAASKTKKEVANGGKIPNVGEVKRRR